jgi:hypothetical protein
MGYDSIEPFLKYKDSFVFVLAVTSNKGAQDFQYLNCEGKPLYMHVVDKVSSWNTDGNLGLVVGASQPEQIREIRVRAPQLPFLIPGVGAQGGDLSKAVEFGTLLDGIVVINVARGVISHPKARTLPTLLRRRCKRSISGSARCDRPISALRLELTAIFRATGIFSSVALLIDSSNSRLPTCRYTIRDTEQGTIGNAINTNQPYGGEIMALIRWSPSLSVKIDEMDKQHQSLLEIMNRLHESILAGKGNEGPSAVIGEIDHAHSTSLPRSN